MQPTPDNPMALIKCRECDNPVSTEASACPHCGAPQRQVPPPLPQDLQQPPPLPTQWEICEIELLIVKNSGLFTPGEARWGAKATGPKGTYTAARSPVFTALIKHGNIRASDIDSSDAENAVDTLTSELLAEGWEFLGLQGQEFWQKQFRRASK